MTGSSRIKLYKGNVILARRKSPYSLYREDYVTFDEDDVYNQADAEGFIKLFEGQLPDAQKEDVGIKPDYEVNSTQKDISNTGSPFDLLVKRELKPHHLDLPNHFIQFAEGDKKGHNVFINDPETGWYLAANYSARAFMAQIMPELPSVKFGDSKLDAMWRGKVQAETKEPFKGTYEANMIHAFALYLTKIVEDLKPNSQNPFMAALKELAAELTTKVKGLSDTTSPVQSVGAIELSLIHISEPTRPY